MLIETLPAFEKVHLLCNKIIGDTTSTYFTRTTLIITKTSPCHI